MFIEWIKPFSFIMLPILVFKNFFGNELSNSHVQSDCILLFPLYPHVGAVKTFWGRREFTLNWGNELGKSVTVVIPRMCSENCNYLAGIRISIGWKWARRIKFVPKETILNLKNLKFKSGILYFLCSRKYPGD